MEDTMTILNSEIAWYLASINYEFSLYGRLISSIDEHIQSDFDEFIAELNEQADNIEDEQVREEFFLIHLIDDQDFEYHKQLFLRSLFVASVSLFEYRFLKICLVAQQKSGNPIGILDLGTFNLAKTKVYLTKLGVDVPAQGVEWHNAQRFYQIRNAIVHKGGFIQSKGDLADFAMQKGIIRKPAFIRPSKNQDAEIKLELTRASCGEALDTLKRLLFQVTHSVVDTFAKKNV